MPISMIDYMQNQDDRLLMRFTTANMVVRPPSLTIQPPSTDRRAPGKVAVSDPLSQRSAPPSGSDAGLSFGGGTSRSSEPSIKTSSGITKLPKIEHRALQTGERGALTIPSFASVVRKYECPFDRWGCTDVFPTFEPWYEHSLTHFRVHAPPNRNSCCFCPKTFDESSGKRSWKNRMLHVQKHHDRSEKLATSRFDEELYRYLWLKKLITDIEWKDLTANPEARPRKADSRTNEQGYTTHLKADDGLRRKGGYHA